MLGWRRPYSRDCQVFLNGSGYRCSGHCFKDVCSIKDVSSCVIIRRFVKVVRKDDVIVLPHPPSQYILHVYTCTYVTVRPDRVLCLYVRVSGQVVISGAIDIGYCYTRNGPVRRSSVLGHMGNIGGNIHDPHRKCRVSYMSGRIACVHRSS